MAQWLVQWTRIGDHCIVFVKEFGFYVLFGACQCKENH